MPTLQLTLKEWTRHRAMDESRRQALARLYRRREAVDDLIRSLEHYQRCIPMQKAECISFSVEARCS